MATRSKYRTTRIISKVRLKADTTDSVVSGFSRTLTSR